MSTFFENSIRLADGFIKSVCFIDDEPFFRDSEAPVNDDNDHRLDATTITKAFAGSGKSCSFYLFESEKEESDIIELAKNSDINVIDWRIKLKEFDVSDLKDEEDIPETESRGKYALRLIKGILKSNSNSPKLIMVLTGENDPESIFKPINDALASLGIKFSADDQNLTLQSEKFRITIFFKEALKRRKVSEIVSKKIVDNKKLPNIISTEFAFLTSGLVSNAVLKSVTIIRDNTTTLLNLFNKELDSPYLGHRVLLPNQSDAEELLINIIKDSIGDLLHYHEVRTTLAQKEIEAWVDSSNLNYDLDLIGLDENKKEINLGKKATITPDIIKTLLKHGFKEGFKDTLTAANLSKQSKKQFEKYFELNSTKVFVRPEIDYRKLDQEYALLTHHKSIFKPSTIAPKLTLGVIVKGEKSGYWVCIQQRCDSVRLEDKVRRFLFLPLKTLSDDSPGKFHFVTKGGIKLQLQKKSFDLRTIKFLRSNEEDIIQATLKDGNYFFTSYYREGNENFKPEIDEEYEWIFDLKELHAQRIVNEFSHELSRVGLDESEWLRRHS